MALDAYTTILVEAHKQGRPHVFRNDLLVYDYRRLHSYDAPPVFGWILRECGTEMLDLRMSRGNMLGFIEHYTVNGKNNLYYLYRNGRLTRYNFGKWCEVILSLLRPDPKNLRRHQIY